MINSTLIWKTQSGPIYGVVAYDSNAHDANEALWILLDKFPQEFIFWDGDILEFEEAEDQESSIGYKYISNAITPEDNHTMIIVTGEANFEVIYEEKKEGGQR